MISTYKIMAISQKKQVTEETGHELLVCVDGEVGTGMHGGGLGVRPAAAPGRGP